MHRVSSITLSMRLSIWVVDGLSLWHPGMYGRWFIILTGSISWVGATGTPIPGADPEVAPEWQPPQSLCYRYSLYCGSLCQSSSRPWCCPSCQNIKLCLSSTPPPTEPFKQIYVIIILSMHDYTVINCLIVLLTPCNLDASTKQPVQSELTVSRRIILFLQITF